MNLHWFLLAGVIVLGCSPKAENAARTEPDSLKAAPSLGFDENNFETYINLDNYKAASEPADFLLVDSTCALVVSPTDDQIKRMEKEYGDDFSTIADDYSFYQSEAILKFDSTDVRVINLDTRYVKFKGKTDTWLLDLRKDGAPEWNIILFSADKKPEITSAVDVTYEKIYEYFFH